jgi:hypothetical protein
MSDRERAAQAGLLVLIALAWLVLGAMVQGAFGCGHRRLPEGEGPFRPSRCAVRVCEGAHSVPEGGRVGRPITPPDL